MRATQILSTEHRVIESVLASLARFVEQSRQGRAVDRAVASQFIEFVQQFADRCHHGKEEGHLFAKMAALGAPTSGGPVGVMLHEHTIGREFVGNMAKSLDAAASGDPAAVEEFCRNAEGYVGLLAAHIQKEDGILYPIADRMMSDADQAELLASFQAVEENHMGVGTHEKFLASAIDLGERFGVDVKLVRDLLSGGQCHCSHSKAGSLPASSEV